VYRSAARALPKGIICSTGNIARKRTYRRKVSYVYIGRYRIAILLIIPLRPEPIGIVSEDSAQKHWDKDIMHESLKGSMSLYKWKISDATKNAEPLDGRKMNCGRIAPPEA